MPTKQVVLAGCGHAHLHIVSQAASYAEHDAEVVLIDSGLFWYSGLATGMLGGQYSAAEDQVSAAKLCQAHGVRFLQSEVAAIDPESKMLTLENGETLAYHLLSLNIGSEVDMPLEPVSNGPTLWPVKPIPKLQALSEALTREAKQQGQMPAVCVVGGGPTGSELTANLLGWAERQQLKPAITLVTRSRRLLPGAPRRVSAKLSQQLSQRGAKLIFSEAADQCVENGLLTDQQTHIPAAHLLFAGGLQAAALTRKAGVAAGREGVKVNRYMQSVSNPWLFAAGDCADFQPKRLPKLGVFGVKAAQIVHQNLLASLANKPLTPFKPQSVWLAILNLGNGSGLLTWWRFWWFGRSSLWLKDRIDRQFMARYQQHSR